MNVQLITNWQDGWRFYSAWAFAFLIAMPELYTMLAPVLDLDTIPNLAKRVVQIAAAAGLIARFIRQVKPAEAPRAPEG